MADMTFEAVNLVMGAGERPLAGVTEADVDADGELDADADANVDIEIDATLEGPLF